MTQTLEARRACSNSLSLIGSNLERFLRCRTRGSCGCQWWLEARNDLLLSVKIVHLAVDFVLESHLHDLFPDDLTLAIIFLLLVDQVFYWDRRVHFLQVDRRGVTLDTQLNLELGLILGLPQVLKNIFIDLLFFYLREAQTALDRLCRCGQVRELG